MILDDYLWFRLWQRWLLLLGVMVIILYSIDFLAQIREYDHWPVLDVAKMVVYRLPMLLDAALPYLGFLTVFFTFSALQNANVFDVMRSSGYSWRRIMMVSALFSCVLALFHIIVFEDMRLRAHEVYQDLLSDHGDAPEHPFKGQDIWLTSSLPSETIVLQAKALREGAFQNISLVVLGPDNALKNQIRAEKAEIRDGVLVVEKGDSWASGTKEPLGPQGIHLPWGGQSREDLLRPSPPEKTFVSVVRDFFQNGDDVSKIHPQETHVFWQGAARPLYYSALAVLATVALLSSHHRTRSFVPFGVSAVLMFVFHMATNATVHWANQGLLPFWYTFLWASVLLLFGSFLVLMRRTYGAV
jgi:lipopolysaccharide export LptBFGC system permease protein LptF